MDLATPEALQSRGLNLETFSREILSDISYIDYWSDAMWFLAVHFKNDPEKLFMEMFQFFERNAPINNKSSRRAKLNSFIIIMKIANPENYKNEQFKELIHQYLIPFYRSNKPYRQEYWVNLFTSTKSISNDVDKDELLNGYIGTATANGIQLAAQLYYITNNPYFKDCILEVQNIESFLPRIMANAVLSDSWKKEWISGQYNLFQTPDAFQRKRTLTKEQMERMKQDSLSAREHAGKREEIIRSRENQP